MLCTDTSILTYKFNSSVNLLFKRKKWIAVNPEPCLGSFHTPMDEKAAWKQPRISLPNNKGKVSTDLRKESRATFIAV